MATMCHLKAMVLKWGMATWPANITKTKVKFTPLLTTLNAFNKTQYIVLIKWCEISVHKGAHLMPVFLLISVFRVRQSAIGRIEINGQSDHSCMRRLTMKYSNFTASKVSRNTSCLVTKWIDIYIAYKTGLLYINGGQSFISIFAMIGIW